MQPTTISDCHHDQDLVGSSCICYRQTPYPHATRKSGRLSGSRALPAFLVEMARPDSGARAIFRRRTALSCAIAQQRRTIDTRGASFSVLL